jgi:hypothetical protein
MQFDWLTLKHLLLKKTSVLWFEISEKKSSFQNKEIIQIQTRHENWLNWTKLMKETNSEVSNTSLLSVKTSWQYPGT